MATRSRAAPSRTKKPPSRTKKPAPRTKKAAPRGTKTPARAISAQQRVISKRTIRSIIQRKFGRRVKWDAPIDDYIKGASRAAIRAFFGPLNRAFKAYALNLKPGDLANVKIVEDLVTVVADWFRRHGYQVTD